MLENKKLFLLDIDGTICKGNQLVEGSAAFLKDIKANGGQFVFITNNATKSIDDYIRFFQVLGIHTDYTNFLTASYVTIDYLKKNHAGELIYVLGTRSFIRELKKNKIHVTSDCAERDFNRWRPPVYGYLMLDIMPVLRRYLYYPVRQQKKKQRHTNISRIT